MPVRDLTRMNIDVKTMFEDRNQTERLESSIDPMDITVGYRSSSVNAKKSREHELENRILFLEDQLYQMNFNLTVVSSMVDLLSKSSNKGHEALAAFAGKQCIPFRFGPGSFVMKGAPMNVPRRDEFLRFRPYAPPKNPYICEQSRDVSSKCKRQASSHSIENLLKSGRPSDSPPILQNMSKAHFSSKLLERKDNVIPHSKLNTAFHSIRNCEQCLIDFSKRDNSMLLQEYCPTVPYGVHTPKNGHVVEWQSNSSLYRGYPSANSNPSNLSRKRDYPLTKVELDSKENVLLDINREKSPPNEQNYCGKESCLNSETAKSPGEEVSSSSDYLYSRPSICNTPSNTAYLEQSEKSDNPRSLKKMRNVPVESLMEHKDSKFENAITNCQEESCLITLQNAEEDEDSDATIEKEEVIDFPEGSPLTDATEVDASFILPDHCSVIEVIKLWEEGTNSIPPIRKWSPIQRAKQKSKISRWRKIMHIFKEKYDRNLSEFLKVYSDNKGRVLPVSAILSIHKDDDSVTDEEYESFQLGKEKDYHKSAISSVRQTTNPRYVLPRKINGRQVTPLDILKIWERGIGSIPPIKQWTPSQKLKQQSKVSRWKKIVDLYKKECSGKLSEFRKKFSYEDGKLMPVSAILARCESKRGSLNSPKLV